MASTVETKRISTKIPSRMDRLPWSRFHWRVVLGLGTVWALDGLEVTMISSVASRLTESGSGIELSAGDIGLAAAFYIIGAVSGALVFGQLTDRFGRKRLFVITLIIYIVATVATAFAFAPWYFFLARFVTGAGIGGEYAAINSAIDELIPARVRGGIDLVIAGTYWLGAAAGAGMALVLLNENLFPANVGWRLAFGFGAVLGLAIMLVRRTVPESPRWLFIHGREDEAERVVGEIEDYVAENTGQTLEEPGKSITVRQRKVIPFRMIANTAFRMYPKRAVLGLALFVGQAFIYNGVTFNLGTLFNTFYGVASGIVPLFIILWTFSNFLGPVVLGRLFDTVGRKPMIAGCYLGSALLIIPLIIVFVQDLTNEWGFLLMLSAIFFLASAGASAAYLTVSEVFPIETRALAIAFFYAVGTALGGIIGPVLFGQLVGTEDRSLLSIAFIVSAIVMAIGGIAELVLGVRAEKANLEDLAKPLTAEEAEESSEEAGEEAGEEVREQAGEEAGVGAASGDGSGAPATVDEHRSEARRLRKESELMRARAAQHRAAGLDEPEGSTEAERRAMLADTADLRAAALEEQAAAADEMAGAARTEGHESAAARTRSEAAEQRSRMLSEREEMLAAEDPAEASVHAELAEAAADWSRAREQHALAEQTRSKAVSAQPALAAVLRHRAQLNEARAGMYEARAQLRVSRTEQDEAAVAHFEQQQVAAERRAMAAEQRLAEAEQRSPEEYAGERRSRESRASTGMRRFRPGPGTLLAGSFRGFDPHTAEGAEEALDREIEAIATALDEHGPTDRNDLARLVGARYWGPGRFSSALRAAVDRGRARRLTRRSYGPPETVRR